MSAVGTRTAPALPATPLRGRSGSAFEAAARRAANAVSEYAEGLAASERPRRLGLSKQIVISAALLRRFAPELEADAALKAAARLVQIQREANAGTVKKCVSEARALLAWLEADHGLSLADTPGDHEFVARVEAALDTASTDAVVLRRARSLDGVRGGRPRRGASDTILSEVRALIRRARRGDTAAARELTDIARLVGPSARFCPEGEVPSGA